MVTRPAKTEAAPGDRYMMAAKMRYVEGLSWARIQNDLDISRQVMARLRKRVKRDMETALKIIAVMREHK